ncbi:MAG: acyl carrier protein [Gemmatimonadota bacterium]|nr:acyl carrier protein [Gemmatimonadota bacterium]
METLHTIREIAAKQNGGEADSIDVDIPVDQLGIDSLGFLEFLFELEDALGLPIPPESVKGVRTLRELGAAVDSLRAAATPPSVG